MAIQKICDNDILAFLSSRITHADSTIKKDYNLVKNAFARAVRNEVIKSNPLNEERFARPKGEKGTKKVRALTSNEQRKFKQIASDPNNKKLYTWAWFLSLATCMRIRRNICFR